MIFFSVIIPLYNKADYIEETIENVLNQRYKHFEIIVVDDGSTDQSLEIVETYNDHRITIIKQANQGVSVARINGISAANYQYIALLDADDLWENDHLEQLQKSIITFPAAILYCNNYQIKRNRKFVTPAVFNFDYGKVPLIIKDFFKANTINYVVSSSSASFRKDEYLKLPGYKPELKTSQDLDLWIQFALRGEVAFNPKITMTYNFYDDLSLSKSNYNSHRLDFIYSYEKEEKNNASLKYYLDINRYALLLRLKLLDGDKDIIKKLKQDIVINNLNFKQQITLHLPKIILKGLKNIQSLLLKNNIYLTAYK